MTLSTSSPRACCVMRMVGRSSRRQTLDRGRHDLAHHARALAAAEDQDLQRRAGGKRRIGCARGVDDGRSHRVARVHDGRANPGRNAFDEREARRDQRHARRQEAVGAPDDAVLLVQHGRDAQQRRRQHGRHRRIAAEADDCGRLQTPQRHEGARDAEPQHERRLGHLRRRAAGRRRGRDLHDLFGRKGRGDAADARVGRQHHAGAEPLQGDGERFGREQVAAGAAGGDDDARRAGHRAGNADAAGRLTKAARGRRRVSAIRKPMASARDSSDEPP